MNHDINNSHSALPAELWFHIFEYAIVDGCTIHDDPPHAPVDSIISRALLFDFPVKYYAALETKYALSLVSRTFQALVEPYLYDTVVCSDSITLSQVLVQPSHSRSGHTKGSLVRRLFFEQPDDDAIHLITPQTVRQIYSSCNQLEIVGIVAWDQTYETFTALAILPEWVSSIHWNLNSLSLRRAIPTHWPIHIRFLELLNCGGQTATLKLPSLETLHISDNISLEGDSYFPSLKDILIVFQGRGTINAPAWFNAILRNHGSHIETITLDRAEIGWTVQATWPILPYSILSSCSNLRAVIFNPLVGNVFERGEAIKDSLPNLTTIGFLLTTTAEHSARVLLGAWNFFRTGNHGNQIEKFAIIHYHNNDDCVERLQSLLGYDQRLSFHCRWLCKGVITESSQYDMSVSNV